MKISLTLTLIFLIIMAYAGVYDWKTRLVKPWTCISTYLIALIIAISKGATVKQIVIHSLWLALFFYIAALIYIKVTGDSDKGVGGGDILIAPAVTLFMFDSGIAPLYIGFVLAWLDGFIFKRKQNNDETPMVMYFFIACLISVFSFTFNLYVSC